MNIFISSLWHQGRNPALSSATKYEMPRKIHKTTLAQMQSSNVFLHIYVSDKSLRPLL